MLVEHRVSETVQVSWFATLNPSFPILSLLFISVPDNKAPRSCFASGWPRRRNSPQFFFVSSQPTTPIHLYLSLCPSSPIFLCQSFFHSFPLASLFTVPSLHYTFLFHSLSIYNFCLTYTPLTLVLAFFVVSRPPAHPLSVSLTKRLATTVLQGHCVFGRLFSVKTSRK